jgi:hypothetical protein
MATFSRHAVLEHPGPGRLERGTHPRGSGTMQVFVRDHFPMIAAPVQCDVDGIPKGSHCVSVSPIEARLSFALHALLPRRFRFTRLGEGGVGNLDLAASLIVRDHEASARDTRSSQVVAVRR